MTTDQRRRAQARELLDLHTPDYCRERSCGGGYRMCQVVLSAGRVIDPGYRLDAAPTVVLPPAAPPRPLYRRPVGARFGRVA